MKKWLLVLGMITCVLGVSAFGMTAQAASGSALMTEEDAFGMGDQLVEAIAMICAQGQQAQYASDAVITAAFDSWMGAQEEMGSYVEITGHTAKIDEKGVVVDVAVKGSTRNAVVEVVLDKNLSLSSVTTNVEYTFAEKMEKAALNTLLGMGTVFVVLILISFLISGFTFIPKIQAAFEGKGAVKEEKIKEPVAVDNTIAQIIEKEELADVSGDFELVAVIAAAIAASEGKTRTDGFVVRSIRKRRAF